MPKKNGELTLSDFKKEAKRYTEKVKVTLDEGYTHIYKYFSPKKIEECVTEFIEYIQELQKQKIELTDLDMIVFMDFHIFKHFSSLKNVIPNDFAKKNTILEDLTSTKMFKQIIDAFDDEQKAEVWKSLLDKHKKIHDMIMKNEDMRVQLLEKIDGMDIEHKDVIKNMLLKNPKEFGLPFANELEIEGEEFASE